MQARRKPTRSLMKPSSQSGAAVQWHSSHCYLCKHASSTPSTSLLHHMQISCCIDVLPCPQRWLPRRSGAGGRGEIAEKGEGKKVTQLQIQGWQQPAQADLAPCRAARGWRQWRQRPVRPFSFEAPPRISSGQLRHCHCCCTSIMICNHSEPALLLKGLSLISNEELGHQHCCHHCCCPSTISGNQAGGSLCVLNG